jgi:hypothetical protein
VAGRFEDSGVAKTSMNNRLAHLARLLSECWDARWQVLRLDPNQTVAANLALNSRSRLLVLADRLEEEKVLA